MLWTLVPKAPNLGKLFNPFPGEYVRAFTCIFTKIKISLILKSTGIQQVSLDSTKTVLPYEGGLVA